jgi:hypothetical protein
MLKRMIKRRTSKTPTLKTARVQTKNNKKKRSTSRKPSIPSRSCCYLPNPSLS